MGGHATNSSGELQELKQCYIKVPGFGEVILKVLPELSDSKGAAYNDEPILGRTFPLKTFSHGENRTISMNCTFIVTAKKDILENLNYLKALESAVYPRNDKNGVNPFKPPPVCEIKCGSLLASNKDGTGLPLCAVLKNYSISYPPDVPWDQDYYLPYKFTVNLQWEVVYKTEDLPGQEQILNRGGGDDVGGGGGSKGPFGVGPAPIRS
jgi:hypothetical protein